jgi:hypothetical protein
MRFPYSTAGASAGSAWEHKDRRLCLREAAVIFLSNRGNKLILLRVPCDSALFFAVSKNAEKEHRWWGYEAEPRVIAFPGRAWERVHPPAQRSYKSRNTSRRLP